MFSLDLASDIIQLTHCAYSYSYTDLSASLNKIKKIILNPMLLITAFMTGYRSRVQS